MRIWLDDDLPERCPLTDEQRDAFASLLSGHADRQARQDPEAGDLREMWKTSALAVLVAAGVFGCLIFPREGVAGALGLLVGLLVGRRGQ